MRRVIEITDFDTSTPVTHLVELYRSDSNDCYIAFIDGQLLRKRIDWSRIFEELRSALPILLQDF